MLQMSNFRRFGIGVRLVEVIPEKLRKEMLGPQWDRMARFFGDTRNSINEHGLRPKRLLRDARRTPEYQEVFAKTEPLVSVCVPTYNRADLLLDRCIASLLAQTYRNIEVIVIGDGCTDHTVERMAKVEDSRVIFENLSKRGNYPVEKIARNNIAGLVPTTRAYELARGDFITRLDDDDEHMVDRIEKLVTFAQREQAEVVYHPFHHQEADDSWIVKGTGRFEFSQVTTGSLFFHRWFLNVPYRPETILKYGEPGDWNFARQCRYIGARVRRHPDTLLRHYKERNQAEP